MGYTNIEFYYFVEITHQVTIISFDCNIVILSVCDTQPVISYI